jgi:hypothetical protein
MERSGAATLDCAQPCCRFQEVSPADRRGLLSILPTPEFTNGTQQSSRAVCRCSLPSKAITSSIHSPKYSTKDEGLPDEQSSGRAQTSTHQLANGIATQTQRACVPSPRLAQPWECGPVIVQSQRDCVPSRIVEYPPQPQSPPAARGRELLFLLSLGPCTRPSIL